MKTFQKLLLSGLTIALLWPVVGIPQPAPESAKALARAGAAAITNLIAKRPDLEHSILAVTHPSLEYYEKVLALTNWNEFITSTSPVPLALHMTLQFYLGVRTNLDDVDPWDRLAFVFTIPVAEAQLDPEEKREMAEKDKQIRLMWLKTFLELGPEQVLKKNKYLPFHTTIGVAKSKILELFDQPHLFETLTVEDWEIVARCLEAFCALRKADLMAMGIEHAAITGEPLITNWVQVARQDLYRQYLPYIADKVLRPNTREMPVNTNLIAAWLTPLAIWVENQCYRLEELLAGVTNIYEQHTYFLPHSGVDKRAFYRFKWGLEGLSSSVATMKATVSPIQTPRQPPILNDRDKRMLAAVRAYIPFEPESPDLQRALDAVQRDDIDTYSETLCIEFAIRNLYYPMQLLAPWVGQLSVNQEAAEALTNIVTRLDRIAVVLGTYGMVLPSPPYSRPPRGTIYTL